MAENNTSTTNGIPPLGFSFAAVMSYMKWHGFWLAVAHGFCGWAYIAYYLIQYGSPFKF